jgi:hypothetical protein
MVARYVNVWKACQLQGLILKVVEMYTCSYCTVTNTKHWASDVVVAVLPVSFGTCRVELVVCSLPSEVHNTVYRPGDGPCGV